MENTMTDNPLKQYFRQPAIHLTLPTNGKYYPEGALEMPVTNELPVFPMTAIDDITYKTPDALFNGSAVIDVIKSCIPSIKDPWQMPTVDLNTVLTAIRIASIGHEMEIESTCPKCEEVADYSIDLRLLIDKAPDVSLYDQELEIGDLKIYFKPLSYLDVNENNKMQFEEERLAQLLSNQEIPDEKKLELLGDAFRKIAKYSVSTISKCIKSIVIPDTIVSDPTHIKEFLTSCESPEFEIIKKHMFKLKEIEELDPLAIKCTECEHEYKQNFTLDMTSFFVRNS